MVLWRDRQLNLQNVIDFGTAWAMEETFEELTCLTNDLMCVLGGNNFVGSEGILYEINVYK